MAKNEWIYIIVLLCPGRLEAFPEYCVILIFHSTKEKEG